MEIKITFPGGKRVNAEVGGHIIKTDQGLAGGGEGSAPEPFLHFLASMGTCAGIYALGFCQARGIPTEGLKLTQRVERDPETHRLETVAFDLEVPPGFPEKSLGGIQKAMDYCAVKKTILDPPKFEISVRTASK